jgi:hypothetical protein
MRANIAESRCSENRVANRMRQCVAVGMSYGSLGKWNFDAAEDQLATFGEAVQIVSDSYASHWTARSWRK